MEKIKECVLDLHNLGVIKFGEFKLKSGILSPFYIDLRLIISSPKLLSEIASLMQQKISKCHYDLICGVPYTALPIATVLSLKTNVPMCLRRKEAKAYGTKKLIEGLYKKGERCLIVEDVITSGMSIFETIDPLKDEGLNVEDIVVFLDRQGGGREKVEGQGYKLHAVLTLKELFDILFEQKRISQDEYELAKRNLQ